MTYPGGKGKPGIAQWIINHIPPHGTFISAFGGHCAVLRAKRPAARSVLIDPDPEVCRWWQQELAVPGLEVVAAGALEWLEKEGFIPPRDGQGASQPRQDARAADDPWRDGSGRALP